MDEVIDIQKDLIKVYQIRENAIQVSISIGISNYPIDTVKTNDLFKFASSAMNHTKRENKGSYEFYAPELHDSTRHKLELLNKLKNALENDEFFLEYQKIIDPYSETIAGYESLIRWQSEGKIIPPNDFIPLAEKSLEINSIGCWVIEESIKALIKLQINNPETFISINLSPVQFKSNDLVLFIEEKIREYDINPSKLHFEITESLFIEDFEQVQEKLMAITDLGCTIALDDFGTGFSSLSYLQRLPISIIKIDRSFVLGIDHPTNRKIIDSIIALGNSLGMIIIAEGIETDEHLKYLKDRNCELIQGYYYSKPLKLNETLKEGQSVNNRFNPN
jgi:EAL domain-containing protein (putative c-di-GMP-specific phosphodiesterase class I)